MLASGDRINPWFQEASERRIQAGDLIGFDTAMVGPFGHFADVSRTFLCGPGRPTRRQKQLYRHALDEIWKLVVENFLESYHLPLSRSCAPRRDRSGAGSSRSPGPRAPPRPRS